MTSAVRQPNRQRGFTLVELIVAVSIVGLLTAIALPTYRTYTMRANRAVAKAALVDLATRQETYFVDRKAYAGSLSDINANGFLSRDSTMTSAQGNTTIYSLSMAAHNTSTCPATGSVGSTSYTLIATPVGNQASDSCGSLCMTSTGIRLTSASTPADCWSR